jgi:transglutaminase-like putative cysteine protease
MHRRTFVGMAASFPLAAAISSRALAQERTFTPRAGKWRTFEVATSVEIVNAGPGSQAWIPIPSVNTNWQKSLDSTWTGNMREATIRTEPRYGANMVYAVWDDGQRSPMIEVVSRFEAQDRAEDWVVAASPQAPANLDTYLKPTAQMPIDGIVRATALKIAAGKTTDVEKVRAVYDWIVTNTYREPTTRGCGVGDIRGMLETGNLGGKCADINALFVGLVRASGIPARDVYGIRVAKSAFGYRELGAGSADITKAQHCRAEVWLDSHGWVAMDPADVGKVMRQETADWIKDPKHPLIAPVNRALFGGWEGNWLAYNFAHDVALPGSKLATIGFLMYPQAETRGERVDSLDPETFKYKITAREVTA